MSSSTFQAPPRKERQVIYELLGAPVLLYRHAPSHRQRSPLLEEPAARQYGNCLLSFLCPCCQSRTCLLHPAGELLSEVRISTITLPRQPLAFQDNQGATTPNGELDLGEKVLQVQQCAPFDAIGCHVVVRTASFTALLFIESLPDCRFNIKLVQRFDLSSSDLSSSQPASFRPWDVTAHPKYGTSFVDPLVAVLSRSNDSPRTNSVHRLGKEVLFTHTINNLRDIDLVEFSTNHPMVLNAAATCYVRPKLVANCISRRPSLGHGSSLFTIDLRANEGTFWWSPSSEEFVTQCVHSISGILANRHDPSQLYVAASSAAKLWQIDVRMAYKAVQSWSLAGLCNHVGTHSYVPGDLYGAGTLLDLPNDEYENGVIRPILSVEKSPGTACLCLYQQPLTRGNFATDSFELSVGQGKAGVSVSRSSVMPLADVSPKVFSCGITSFRSRACNLLSQQECEAFGYRESPSDALNIVTMTNNGDLYAHVLLECSDGERTRAVESNSLAIPSRTLPVPKSSDTNNDKKGPGMRGVGWRFKLNLCNSPPLQSSQILKTCIEPQNQATPFLSIPLSQLRENCQMNPKKRAGVSQDEDQMLYTAMNAMKSADEWSAVDHRNGDKDLVALATVIWDACNGEESASSGDDDSDSSVDESSSDSSSEDNEQ